MREISAVLSDEISLKLEVLSKEMDISKETIIEYSLREYLSKLERNRSEKVMSLRAKQSNQEGHFNPVGFGMWKDREDMKDSAKWVRTLREKEWKREY
ncbi:MAG: hypothetical protein ACE5PV_14785 [Candidatus Poribacteria bacterium]